MRTVSLSEARSRLSQLLRQVEKGEEIVITRRGKPIVRIIPVVRPKLAVRSLVAFRRRMPRWRKASTELLQEMRDEGAA